MRVRSLTLTLLLSLAIAVSCTNELSPGFGTATPTPTPSGTTPPPTPTPISTQFSGTVKPTRCWSIASSDGTSVIVAGAAPEESLFSPGTRVLLWQVQASGATAGNQSDITTTVQVARAGEFELNRSTGTQTMANDVRVFLANITSLLYGSVAGGSAAQVCVVPVFDSVTAAGGTVITADAWDGTKGGVVAFEAASIDLGTAIVDVEGLGFQGGRAASEAMSVCDVDTETTTDFAEGGGKGEGLDIGAYFANGRGNLWNGAGGGNGGYGGGGGGGNGGFGGSGGNQTPTCTTAPERGRGKGGSRILVTPATLLSFGGGGGAGQGNAGGGGAGGGVVWIVSGSVFAGSGEINASGMGGLNAVSGGGGGGGAGGTIVIDTVTSAWSGTLRAQGGPGGFGSSGTVGQGGGGGGGRIVRDGTGGTAVIIAGPAGTVGIGGASAGDPGASY